MSFNFIFSRLRCIIKNMRSAYTQTMCVDGLKKMSKEPDFFDLPLSRYVVKHKNLSTLFYKEKITLNFLTQDSQYYHTSFHAAKKMDSLKDGKEKAGFHHTHTSLKLWNASLVGAVVIGMFFMMAIHRYLGQSVSAKIQEDREQQLFSLPERDSPQEINEEIDPTFITQVVSLYQNNRREDVEDKVQFEGEIRRMVKGYPIEKMAFYIAQQDKVVAAFLVGIARKESNWGKRVPILDGRDCYNYWGYRGIRDSMGSGGHTCFDSPFDAVETVSRRIKFLVSSENLDTPSEMIIWKCGYDCSWDNPESMRSWIRDVGVYFDKLNEK